MKRLFVVLVFLLWFAAPVSADFEAGMTAYDQGDYATALGELKPLAENGSARAQVTLGVMHSNGQGVPQDFKEALRWFRLAADQGNADAQFYLGAVYADGKELPQNYVRAYMWLSLAAAQGHKNASHARDLAAGQMSQSQLEEAQRLAREWKSKK